MDESTKFSPAELAAHRAAAAKGILPTPEILAKFVRTIRVGFSAIPAKVSTKGRVSKTTPKPTDDQIDFF